MILAGIIIMVSSGSELESNKKTRHACSLNVVLKMLVDTLCFFPKLKHEEELSQSLVTCKENGERAPWDPANSPMPFRG